MPLMGHLTELRKRITYVAAIIVVFVIAAFVEQDYVFKVLMWPLRNTGNQELVTLAPTEAFMQILKVSIYAGLICAIPFILWQFWAFIMPALYENERKSIFPYVLLTTVLFLAGISFGYFIVLPVGLKFLMGYGGEAFNQMLRAADYISFVSMFELAFGVVFELPLVMMLLAWAGIIDYVKMRKWRKYAVIIMAVVAMVLTPSQDPVSMALMLIPLIVLYEFGIQLSRLAAKRKARRQKLAALAEGKDDSSLPEAEGAGS
jgi:sec-independent protein translocase protein TatC